MWQTLRDNPEVLWGFLLALVVVVILTPAVGRFARILGVVDEPGERRRIHVRPIPRLGGIALLLGIFIPALAFLTLGGVYRGILLGAAVATFVGVVDDFRGLPWWGKLGGQVSAAAIAVGFGVHVERFTFPLLGIQQLPDWVGIPLSMLWIVAIMNMVNFLDGMDGLAAGICAIAGSTFAIIALSLGKPEAAILSAIVAGACFGFLRHNFYPARIFMGDSGAMLLGFVLAAVSIQGLLKTAATVALFFPLVVLAIPIVDTSFVFAKRLKYRQPLVHGRPHAPAPPVREHRLLPAAGGALHVRVVRDPRRRGAVDALHPVPRARRLAPLADPRRRRDRARRPGHVGLHRLPAGDRQAREPADPAARAAGAGGAEDRLSAPSTRSAGAADGLDLVGLERGEAFGESCDAALAGPVEGSLALRARLDAHEAAVGRVRCTLCEAVLLEAVDDRAHRRRANLLRGGQLADRLGPSEDEHGQGREASRAHAAGIVLATCVTECVDRGRVKPVRCG